MEFEKYQGTGNDFVVMDGDGSSFSDDDVRALCDRHYGIGADGILFVGPATGGVDGSMIVRNADGSRPEMCGNGLRCVALYVARKTGKFSLQIATDAGVKACEVLDGASANNQVRIAMGRVVAGDTVHLSFPNAAHPVELVLADAGNPHAIRFGSWDEALVEQLGLSIATHSLFPRGTNAEFADVQSDHIRLVVWERGVGRTLACGTGACATAVAAWEQGLTPRRPTEVRLPGGPLVIAPAGEAGEVTLEGGAVFVFRGSR